MIIKFAIQKVQKLIPWITRDILEFSNEKKLHEYCWMEILQIKTFFNLIHDYFWSIKQKSEDYYYNLLNTSNERRSMWWSVGKKFEKSFWKIFANLLVKLNLGLHLKHEIHLLVLSSFYTINIHLYMRNPQQSKNHIKLFSL